MNWPRFLGVVVSLPIFFSVRGTSISLAPRNEMSEKLASGTVVPISFFFLIPLVAFACLQIRNRKIHFSICDFVAFFYVVIMTLALFFGQIIFGQEIQRTIVLYIQTILPVAWYCIARVFVVSPDKCPQESSRLYVDFVWAVAVVVSMSMALYVVQTVVSGGSDYKYSMISDRIGPFFNFKIKKFYSPFLAVASCVLISFGVAHSTSNRRAFWCLLGGALCAAGSFFVWSRTGILTVLVGLLLVFILALGRIRVRRTFFRLVLFLSAILGTVATISVFEAQAFVRMAATIDALGDDQLSAGDSNRLNTMSESAQLGLMRPFGDMFRLVERADGAKTVGSENGFLDIAARGGPVAMILVILLGCFCISRLVSYIRYVGMDEGAVACLRGACGGFVAIFFVSGILLTVLLEPYCSALIWAMMGGACSLPVLKKSIVAN